MFVMLITTEFRCFSLASMQFFYSTPLAFVIFNFCVCFNRYCHEHIKFVFVLSDKL